MQAHR